jgi:DNA-binding response OmpR family regulator
MNQPTILIVDDRDNNRGVLRDALGSEPYRLLEAVDGRQALDIADKEQPDLILLDVLMPGLDGIATLQKLKADDRTRHIPVIMVTALNRDTQVSMCLESGAIDHIVKPFSNLVVRARVRAVLQNRRPPGHPVLRVAVEHPSPADHDQPLGASGRYMAPDMAPEPSKHLAGLPSENLTGLVDLYFYESTVLLKKDCN